MTDQERYVPRGFSTLSEEEINEFVREYNRDRSRFMYDTLQARDRAYKLYQEYPEEILTFLGLVGHARENGLEYPLYPENPAVRLCVLLAQDFEIGDSIIQAQKMMEDMVVRAKADKAQAGGEGR